MTQPEQSHAILQLIDERDDARTFADQLAAALALLAGVDIGEHSNGNNPWRNALDAADRLRGRVQAVDRAAELRDQMAVRFDFGADMVPPRIFEDIARRWPDGAAPLTPLVKRCTCDVPNEPQFPHRPWCDLMHDCSGADCTVCSPAEPPADLVEEFPAELGQDGAR